MANPKPKKVTNCISILSSLFIIIFGFTLSFSFYFYSQNSEEDQLEQHYEQSIHAQSLRIQAKIQQSNMVLQSYFGFLDSQGHVTRDEYRLFSEVILNEHPEIFAVHWTPRIKHADRAAIEAQLAALDLAPLGIFDVNPDANELERAPKREEYFPVIYAEPLEINRKAVGLDPLARPYNTVTIREAARHGMQDTTPPFPIVQDPDGPLSVALYHPIYSKNKAQDTPEQRWDALKGYIILMLRPGLLLKEYQAEFSKKDIQVRLIDTTNEIQLKIYPRADSPEDLVISNLADPKIIQHSWQVPGRQWTLEFYSDTDKVMVQGSFLPLALLIIMLLLTLVFASFIFNAFRQSEKLKLANLALLERQKELDDLAYYDQLTHLPNRSLLNEHLKRILSLEERDKSFSAICVMDLDGFKEINDVYGHDAGDQVLKDVAARLLDNLRDSDVAARVGGDEFVFILTGLHLIEPIDEIITRIIDEINQPILLNTNQVNISVSASIGVSLSKTRDNQSTKTKANTSSKQSNLQMAPQETSPEEKAILDSNIRKALLKDADIAMYQAKKQGKGKHVLFSL